MGTEIPVVNATTSTMPVKENDSQETMQANAAANSKASNNLNRKQADDLVKDLNKSMQQMGTQVAFSVDSDTKHVVIKVIDTATKEVIRQIPPEEILRVSENIKKLLGVRVDQAV
ncbi:MAG TPA: flagellar protein FlaG [Bacteroidota bacterium]|nr:flagellar protein FlaG [Bacteroidota bacterium]